MKHEKIKDIDESEEPDPKFESIFDAETLEEYAQRLEISSKIISKVAKKMLLGAQKSFMKELRKNRLDPDHETEDPG